MQQQTSILSGSIPEHLRIEQHLRRLGLTDALLAHWQHERSGQGGLARVLSAHRGRWLVAGHHVESASPEHRGLDATLAAAAGRLIESEDQPVTGDWVALRPQAANQPGAERLEVIEAVLPRTTWVSREAPGNIGRRQVLAANVDLVLCVMAMGQNYQLSRMERYLSTAWESGAMPVIVITKIDVEEAGESVRREIRAMGPGVPCIFCSSVTGEGIQELEELLLPGQTSVLMGSSGAGKSTLLNALAGQSLMASGCISDAVGKGRHTTVSRELFALPSGTLMIDSPGMRELALDCDGSSVDSTFAEVESLAAQCRFSDCGHQGEPGCAVQQAFDEGQLEERRLKHWHKQRRETERQVSLSRAAERRSQSRKGKDRREIFEELDPD